MAWLDADAISDNVAFLVRRKYLQMICILVWAEHQSEVRVSAYVALKKSDTHDDPALVASPPLVSNTTADASALTTGEYPNRLPIAEKAFRYMWLASSVNPKRAKKTTASRTFIHSSHLTSKLSHGNGFHSLAGTDTGPQSEWIAFHPGQKTIGAPSYPCTRSKMDRGRTITTSKQPNAMMRR